MERQLASDVKNTALENGADLVGVVKVIDLPEHSESIINILPAAQSVVIVIAKHSLAAISCANNQVGQFDTIHAYNECARAAHSTARYLESKGFPSAAVPAFLPIDMADPKKGMRGEMRTGFAGEFTIDRTDYGIDWRPEVLGKEVTLMLGIACVKK